MTWMGFLTWRVFLNLDLMAIQGFLIYARSKGKVQHDSKGNTHHALHTSNFGDFHAGCRSH